MRITDVTIENWGPYRGQQSLNIDTDKTAKVVVVLGDNGNGKTKLIDALKWVFAGGEHGLLKVGPYINLQAIEAGEPFETSVEVKFRQGGNDYSLRRFLSFDPSVFSSSSIESVRQFILEMPDKSRVSLRKLGIEPYSQEQALRVMERLFPARLVGFYFFDAAKLLDNFVSISGSKSGAGGLPLKASVEMAMGLRGLDVFRNEIEKLEVECQNLVFQEIKDKDTAEKFAKDFENRERERVDIERLLQEKRAEVDVLRIEKDELNEKLTGSQSLLDAQAQRNRLNFEIQSLQNSETVLRQKLPSQIKALWMAPMANKMAILKEDIAGRAESRNSRTAEVLFINQQLAYFAKQADSEICLACGQAAQNGKVRSKEQTAELEARRALLTSPDMRKLDGRDAELENVLNGSLFTPVTQHRFDELVDFKNNITELKRREIGLLEELERIDQAFGKTDNSHIVKLNERYLQVEQEFHSANRSIAALSSDFDKVASAAARAKTKLAKYVGGESIFTRRLEGLRKFLSALDKVSDRLRLEVREALEAEANLIFSGIRSEADSAFTIGIDENYFLTTSKHNPNAAYMQQVFLSFLFAIPRVAKAPFPVVIDSPIQHLDLGNRERFLRWCKAGLSQLVLLPHDGEILPDQARSIFGESLSALYEISHDSASGASEFVMLNER